MAEEWHEELVVRKGKEETMGNHLLVGNPGKHEHDKDALRQIANDASMDGEDGTDEPCGDLVVDLGALQAGELT